MEDKIMKIQYCIKCGHKLPMTAKYCPFCGEVIDRSIEGTVEDCVVENTSQEEIILSDMVSSSLSTDEKPANGSDDSSKTETDALEPDTIALTSGTINPGSEDTTIEKNPQLKTEHNNEEELEDASAGMCIISCFFPIIGFVAVLYNIGRNKKKAGAYAMWAGIGFLIGFGFRMAAIA